MLIQNVLSAGLLDSLGVEPLADSDRDEQFQALVASQPQFGQLDDHGQQVVTDNVVQFGQLDDVTVDDLGDLESRYEASPASLGVVCAQLFTATDADAAVAAVERAGRRRRVRRRRVPVRGARRHDRAGDRGHRRRGDGRRRHHER